MHAERNLPIVFSRRNGSDNDGASGRHTYALVEEPGERGLGRIVEVAQKSVGSRLVLDRAIDPVPTVPIMPVRDMIIFMIKVLGAATTPSEIRFMMKPALGSRPEKGSAPKDAAAVGLREATRAFAATGRDASRVKQPSTFLQPGGGTVSFTPGGLAWTFDPTTEEAWLDRDVFALEDLGRIAAWVLSDPLTALYDSRHYLNWGGLRPRKSVWTGGTPSRPAEVTPPKEPLRNALMRVKRLSTTTSVVEADASLAKARQRGEGVRIVKPGGRWAAIHGLLVTLTQELTVAPRTSGLQESGQILGATLEAVASVLATAGINPEHVVVDSLGNIPADLVDPLREELLQTVRQHAAAAEQALKNSLCELVASNAKPATSRETAAETLKLQEQAAHQLGVEVRLRELEDKLTREQARIDSDKSGAAEMLQDVERRFDELERRESVLRRREENVAHAELQVVTAQQQLEERLLAACEETIVTLSSLTGRSYRELTNGEAVAMAQAKLIQTRRGRKDTPGVSDPRRG